MEISFKNIFLVCFSLICLFGFSVGVKAKGAVCAYNSIIITVDENLNITKEKNGSYSGILGTLNFNGSAFLNSEGEFYCPTNIYRKETNQRGMVYDYSLTFDSDYNKKETVISVYSSVDNGNSSSGTSGNTGSSVGTVDCGTLLGDYREPNDPMYWINWGLNLMKYIAIISLLILVTMDFLSAMTQNDKDALAKAGKKALRRFIYCVILFFIPKLIIILFDLFGIAGSCTIGGV